MHYYNDVGLGCDPCRPFPDMQMTTPFVYDAAWSVPQQMAAMRAYMDKLYAQIQSGVTEDELKESVKSLQDAIAAMGRVANLYSDRGDDEVRKELANVKAELMRIIENVNIGKVLVKDPTDGIEAQDIEAALEHVYENDRYFAITAEDYDACQIETATYDDAEITARDYDQAGAVVIASNSDLIQNYGGGKLDVNS